MKYKSISVNEEVPTRLIKFMTAHFAKKEIVFNDFSNLLNQTVALNEKLKKFDNVGCLKQKLYQRPFQWILDVPDEEKLYSFYTFVLVIDEALLRIFRAYHMRLMTEKTMKANRKIIMGLVTEAKALLGGDK